MTNLEFKAIRKQLGLTQARIAELIYCHARTIQSYERGTLKVPRLVEEFLKYKTAEWTLDDNNY